MSVAAPFLVFLLIGAVAAYHRLRLPVWAALTATALVGCWLLGANPTATIVAGVLVALIAVPLLLPQIRLPLITAPLLKFYTKILPPLSETERVALEAGTVGWEGELFSGKPDWDVLFNQAKPELTADEQAFLGRCSASSSHRIVSDDADDLVLAAAIARSQHPLQLQHHRHRNEQRLPVVEHEIGPRHELRCIRTEEQHHRVEPLLAHQPPLGEAGDLLLARLGIEPRIIDRGADIAGGDGVDVDPGPRPLIEHLIGAHPPEDRHPAAPRRAVRHNSPMLATLSAHHAANFGVADDYGFCPAPLDFVFHSHIDALSDASDALLADLLRDVTHAEIEARKQGRLHHGIQSAGNLFRRSEPSFARLAALIGEQVARYRARLAGESCIYAQDFPAATEFSSSWYVKMSKGGHLTSHIHETGWLSGVVYLAIPRDRPEGSTAGGIEFSTDGDDYPREHDDFPRKTLLPVVGDIVLFPSSLFHRTIPFESNEERICIAFDVKPG